MPALITGDYPTLSDIDAAYGRGQAVRQVYGMIANLSLYAGGNMLTAEQASECARIVTSQYPWLKITELLVFFARFKAGCYGRFYGSHDPTVITSGLQSFVRGFRDEIYRQHESRISEERERRSKSELMNYEEWQEIKMLTRMYEMPTRFNNYLKEEE